MRVLRAQRCDRARQWVSLRVDGELSELESRLLADHLSRCDDCSTFSADVTENSRLLRGAPLAPFRAAVRVPRRRRVPVRPLSLAAAAAIAAVVVAVFSLELGTAPPQQQAPRAPRIVPPATPDDMVGTNIARRAKLIADSPHFWAGPRGFQLT